VLKRLSTGIFEIYILYKHLEDGISSEQYKLNPNITENRRCASITKTNRLMLFRDTIAVYCENHTEHINTFCGKNSEILDVEIRGIYGRHHREIFCKIKVDFSEETKDRKCRVS
jgi:hypothetical protein